MIILLICLISDWISIPFQFLLFPELLESGWVGTLIISCVINIYITLISDYYIDYKKKDIEEVIIFLNYGFFIDGYVIVLVVIAISVFCLSCLCSRD